MSEVINITKIKCPAITKKILIASAFDDHFIFLTYLGNLAMSVSRNELVSFLFLMLGSDRLKNY